MGNYRNCELGLAITAALAFYSHSSLSGAADLQPQQSTADAEVRDYVGKGYWIALPKHMLVCPELKSSPDCAMRSGHFRVDEQGPTSGSIVALRVTFDGQPTGWTATSLDVMKRVFLTQAPVADTIYPSFLDRLPKKVADERRKLAGVVIGMREDEVLAGAWGAPLSKKMVQSSRGLREEWHYPHGNALYFHNGVLEGYEK